ncbi:XRE family transcriptional regulator [Thiospirochaeta perfilievii]|uniref:XRE family transcriptional regulator n=1 Tax=Thiospirochaeta perfilievii TaxID=252967 RepID=A0A5C1Q7N6_9SPIO|nr:helix-turn-helix transcriptional regulator [Thiospirochaeta perfilievii]QEN03397.1 XRE family transcriptional regulator [Thiospirochaeta perfilievii]
MINLLQKTPGEINSILAKRMANIRKRRKITQKQLSSKSGVTLASLKRFEQTGDISLISFTKIAIALELDKELNTLFTAPHFNSIQEIINEQN